jgi:hypothetical protein
MLFTPLLPNAGPTGGEGDAWPAPTINLTIWSFVIAFLAIVNAYAQLQDGLAEKASEVLGVEDFPIRHCMCDDLLYEKPQNSTNDEFEVNICFHIAAQSNHRIMTMHHVARDHALWPRS